MDRGDLGVVICVLAIVIVVLWRWGLREREDKRTMQQLVANNTNAMTSYAQVMSLWLESQKKANELNEKFQINVLIAFNDAIKNRR